MTATIPRDAVRPVPRILRAIWSRMTATYNHRWVSANGDAPEHDHDGPYRGELTDAGKVWAHELRGITAGQITHALDSMALKHTGWPPTLPEFRMLCLGIPPLERVQMALNNPDAHGEDVNAFVRLVWTFIGSSWRFARSDERQADRILRGAYKLAVEYRLALGELPPKPKALLVQDKTPREPTAEEIERNHAAAAECIRQAQEKGLYRRQDPEFDSTSDPAQPEHTA